MGKASAPATGPGIYSATYSGIPVYEYQFGTDLKEHVMRRRHDDWINATHILKAAGFDKPARTRILERDVQKDVHEKIQGGYGKYQGTWIPLDAGEALARRHSALDRIKPIFDFVPGDESPPPAPRHATKPKAFKSRPAPSAPKWGASKPLLLTAGMNRASLTPSGSMTLHEEYDNNGDTIMGGADDDTPDNLTVASASYMADEDRYDLSHASAGPRRRRREGSTHDSAEQQHSLYGDELLDYFLLCRNEQRNAVKPEPPQNFQPNWLIDAENHTALHWASAMGDVDVIKQLKRHNANVSVKNIRGETPLMRSVNFTNCYEKQSFPAVIKELFETVGARDNSGCTVIHHAAIMKNGRVFSPTCSRYYLDNILNRLQEALEPSAFQQLLDTQDKDGNTAMHLAAQRNARKCVRALLGRNASTDLTNNEGVRAEDLIMELSMTHRGHALQRSSSPFAPDSQRHASFRDAFANGASKQPRRAPQPQPQPFQSAAATAVQSRISPLIMDKFQDLARSYDVEWQEKDVAESEALRILNNTQAELSTAQQQIAELEAQMEPDDVAAEIMGEANRAKHQVLSLITHQNRLHIARAVEAEVARVNGDAAGAMDEDAAPEQAQAAAAAPHEEERLALARQLSQVLAEQREVEVEYVDALSMVGVGDKIEKYRRLLRRCLDPKDGESLDSNLDSLIGMMEEEMEVHEVDAAAAPLPKGPAEALPAVAAAAAAAEPVDRNAGV